jgi:phosphate acetyltransferase
MKKNWLTERLIDYTRRNPMRITLSDADDSRAEQAAIYLVEQELAEKVVLIYKSRIPQNSHVNKYSKIETISLAEPPKALQDAYAKFQVDMGQSNKALLPPINQAPVAAGCLLVATDQVDAVVGGNISSTADVVKAGMRVFGMGDRKNRKNVSSFFVMMTNKKEIGHNGTLVYADAGVVPDPNAKRLADIAINTAKNCIWLLGLRPRIAFLSFSTHGSAEHESIDKIKEAVQIARESAPEDFVIDGELQADAALIPEIAERKCDESPIQGSANILVFPDLNSANIAYKLTQRLANAEAYGPLLQGVRGTINDLSRGCNVSDIIHVSMISLMKAHLLKKNNPNIS